MKLKYCAGVMDRGSIKLRSGWYKNGRGKSYKLSYGHIQICSTDFETIRYLQKQFGVGNVYPRKSRITTIGNLSKPQLMWQIKGKNTASVCENILPHLRTEKRKVECEKIIEYYKHK